MPSAWNSAQNRQLYPTSKQCIIFTFLDSNICVLTFCFILIGEKRLGGHHSEDTRDPTHHQEGEVSPRQHPEDLEEAEVEEVGEIVTKTGDVLVVEQQAEHFTSDSAQKLIHDIMVWNDEIDIIRKKQCYGTTNEEHDRCVEENINCFQIPSIFTFVRLNHFFFFVNFKSQILKMHTVCQHVLSAIRGSQCMRFVNATPSS
ncbi:hypothetical protein AB205_0190720 [Aquarana catesbeiana]|uniref:Uncharacterized protein n=1 Tax=Aquarana catesbeiana TaxID=8400 RepID=A0A2G9RJ39_AQUCT|nr:hypothetical protein AB205_0190720 [Aquarana catesbeiana]